MVLFNLKMAEIKDLDERVKNVQKINRIIKHRKKRKYLVNLVLLFVILIIFFVFLEITFRVVGIEEPVGEDYSFIKHSDYNPFLMFGPNINKSFPQTNGEDARWNSQGFRSDEETPIEKEVGEYRIIALGGSTTANLRNGKNLHYAKEANKLLENVNGKKINILNSGMVAYTTAHNLIRLQIDLLKFNPDMITLMNNINDLTVNFYPYYDERNNYANKYLHEFYANRYDIKDGFLRKSRVISFTYHSLNNIKGRLSGFSKSVDLEGEKVIINMANIAKAQGITAVFMSQPAVFTDEKLTVAFGYKPYNYYMIYPKIEEFQRSFEEYNKIIRDVAEQEDIYFIDIYNLMGHDEKYFDDTFHYSADGIIRFAEIYSNELKKIIEEETKNVGK